MTSENERPAVTVLDYGAGNLRSVVKAFEHEGVDVTLTADPAVARRAGRLVLPGQGHFGQCMTRLEASGLGAVVRDHVEAGRPFLGICVGMQLLYAHGEEAPDVPGLGLLPGTVARLATTLHLPHVGWNRVDWTAAADGDPVYGGVAAAGPAFFYHVHSFGAAETDAPHVAGVCAYGEATFASAVRRENVWGIQFHPEKSQEAGLGILGAFARAA